MVWCSMMMTGCFYKCQWKSRVQTSRKAFKVFRQPRKKNNYCNRYIRTKHRRNSSRIANKTVKPEIMARSCKLIKDLPQLRQISFEAEGFEIGIDNHTSRCISPSTSDFVGPIRHTNGLLTGVEEELKFLV